MCLFNLEAAVKLPFSQILFQSNSCFVGVNLLKLCFSKVSKIFCPKFVQKLNIRNVNIHIFLQVMWFNWLAFQKTRKIKPAALSNRLNAAQAQSNYMHVYGMFWGPMDSQQRCSRPKLSVFTKYLTCIRKCHAVFIISLLPSMFIGWQHCIAATSHIYV